MMLRIRFGIPIVAHFSGEHLWHTAFLIGAGFAMVSALAWLGIDVGSSARPAAGDTP